MSHHIKMHGRWVTRLMGLRTVGPGIHVDVLIHKTIRNNVDEVNALKLTALHGS